jgi:hypothetical protein
MDAAATRARVIAGDHRAFGEALQKVAPHDRDAWTDAVLGIEPPPPDEPLPAGAVPYLPCGVDEILAVVHGVPVGARDVVVDLGAGLGRVAMLVHLLSGSRTVGIEIQPQLVERARATAGSVFFLYAPFNGALLRRVLAKLSAVERPFVVCAVDLELDVDWLVSRPSSHRSVAIYDTVARHS